MAVIGRALQESSALMCKPDDSLSIRMLNDVLAMIFYHEDRVILSQTKVKYFGEKIVQRFTFAFDFLFYKQ